MDDTLNFSNVPEQGSIERKDTPITVDEVKPHLTNPKKERAQIRMTVESVYPEAQVGNQLNDSVFSFDSFGFGDGNSYEEKRVAWIDVPAGTTKEQVEEQLAKFPQARIYRIMSLQPVITEEQERAMENGISMYVADDGNKYPVTPEYYERKQRVVNTETGEVVNYKGLPQYRVLGFSRDGKADKDLRPQQFAALNSTASDKEEEFKLTDAAVKEKVNQAGHF